MSSDFSCALEGIVVCDFSWVGAGPIATNVLGQCGARIIRIESRKRPDLLRKSGPFKGGVGQGLERSGYFANRNPNKESITLDMGHPAARKIAVRLIEKSDIVINNFRVGQMEKWDLSPAAVRKINGRCIYVTMSLQGTDGPHRSHMGFGVNLNALCGLTALSAMPGQKPFGTGTNYTDHVMVPTHTLFAVMAALLHREKTGRGQTVAVSQLESAICMKPTDVMAYAASGEIAGPTGTADPNAAPHGVYKTLGHRKWIAIAVFQEEEWQRLIAVMGYPVWTESDRFSTLAGRKENEAELDRKVERWTRHQDGGSLMTKLVENGVRAGTVNNAQDVTEDVHLKDRGFFSSLDHSVAGITVYNRAPMLFSGTPVRLSRAAPLIGEHTKMVLTEMLGYSEEEVEKLAKEEVLT